MKKIITNNLGLKLLSILFAILLWLIVVNVDDPEVTRKITGIPVTPLDENVVTDNNQVYSIISGDEVTITVTGPRSMVDKMTKEYFVAEAPFSEKSNVDAVPIYVSFRNSKYDKECEITQKTMSMKLKIEQVETKTFDISVSHTGDLGSTYYLGKESVSPSTVTLSAPESIINQIGNVVAEIDLSNKTEDFSTQTNIKYCTEDGKEVKLNSYCSANSTAVTYNATIYQMREVPVKVGSVGTVADGYVLADVTSDVATVKIAGPSAGEIENIAVPDELINVSGAEASVTAKIDLTTLIPSGVFLCDEDNRTITVTADVEKMITKTYTIPASAIDKNNIPDGYKAEITDQSVTISLTGLQKVHDQFNISLLSAYVDLKNTVEGDNQVVVKVTLPDGLTTSNLLQVNVKLEKTDSQTESQDSQSSEQETTTVAETETAAQ